MTFDFKNLKSDISNISKTIKFVYDSDKRLCYVRLFLIIVQSVLPLISLYLLKVLIDIITNSGTNSSNEVWYAIALVSGIFLLTQISSVVNTIVGEILGQRIINFINNVLHNKSLELDLTYYDNPEYHDTFHRAQQEAAFRPIQILNNISELIKNVISFVGVAAILASLSGYVLLIMIIAGIPALLIRLTRTKIFYEWKKENTSLYRKVNYFSMLMTHRIYAKEIRIFKLGKHIQNTHDNTRETLLKQVIILLKKQAKGNVVSSFFEVGALTIALILLTMKFYSGEVTIGGFVMFFAAVRSANTYLNGIVSNVTGIYNNKLFLSNLFEFMDLTPQIKQIQSPYLLPKLKKGIRFENVSFHYQGSTNYVLDNISFSIKPGETVLITGKNGAGKTTLINLLCRMYECTSGTITFDDINIRDIDIDSLHKNIGIIYQDYCKYDLTVKDNIRFGDVDKENSLEEVAEISGAKAFIENYPEKYDTIVGKYFKDGEELSTGQWQKIALARAFYGDSQIIILDEPTSSIDLSTENNFFEKLQNHAKDKIIIIIGHKITRKIKADSYFSLQKGKLTKVNQELVNA